MKHSLLTIPIFAIVAFGVMVTISTTEVESPEEETNKTVVTKLKATSIHIVRLQGRKNDLKNLTRFGEPLWEKAELFD